MGTERVGTVTDRQTDKPAFQPRKAVLSEGRRMGHAAPHIGKTVAITALESKSAPAPVARAVPYRADRALT
eukprot:3831498-Pyramimonas_sp.AAC.1